jgi:hypothetical protein
MGPAHMSRRQPFEHDSLPQSHFAGVQVPMDLLADLFRRACISSIVACGPAPQGLQMPMPGMMQQQQRLFAGKHMWSATQGPLKTTLMPFMLLFRPAQHQFMLLFDLLHVDRWLWQTSCLHGADLVSPRCRQVDVHCCRSLMHAHRRSR